MESQDDRKVNREAEKSVISCMLQEQKTISTATSLLEADDFDVENYQKVFSIIKELSNKGEEVNIVSVRDALISKGEKGDIVDVSYLSDIGIYVAYPLQIQSYIDIVKEKSVIRKIIALCNKINFNCIKSDMSSEKILLNAQTEFFKVSEKKTRREYAKILDIIPDVLIKIGENAKHADGITGIRTNFKRLDKKTAGFQKGNFIVLAARPGVGKTAFALNLAYNIAEADSKVAFFSLEMTREELVMRILAMESRISSEKLRASSNLSQGDWAHLIDATGFISNNITFDDFGGTNIAEVRTKCLRMKEEDGLDIVFIDYLQLMEKSNEDNNKYGNRQEEVAKISRNIKKLAKDLNVPIVALAQTRRHDSDDKKNDWPKLEDLRESGAIEQDADIVMFLHNPHKNEENSDKQNEIQLIIAKHRNGAIGNIPLIFDKTITKFYESIDDYTLNSIKENKGTDSKKENV